jgi:hypothetical protein
MCCGSRFIESKNAKMLNADPETDPHLAFYVNPDPDTDLGL